MRRAMRAWVLSVVLVPMVFALAIAAVFIPRSAGPAGRSPGGASPLTQPAQPQPVVTQPSPPTPPAASELTISLTALPTGGPPVALTVRIAIVPPVQQDTLDAARGYLGSLLESLVRSLPHGWTPDEAGLAALRRAIEEAIPVALAPSLPAGTRVTVAADVAVSPERPSP